MDTRTPPIAPRTQERSQQSSKIKQQQQHQEEVTLPPLGHYSSNQRQKTKFAPTSTWRHNNAATPSVLRQQEIQRRRPYKVLSIGATPLMHACQQADRARVLKLLREQEETIGYRDRALRSALHYCMDAATGGAVAQAAPELVDAPDAEGHTPLHLAVIAGDHQLVAVLLANGADVNAKDLEGHSVLHWATVCGEVECVRLVLAAGADPSAADLRGGSPLHYAAQCCGAAATAELAVPKKVGQKVLQTLLEFGADVNARDEDGRQPILWAASAGSVDAILALVRAGGSAAAGASDKDGLTALHCAASRGHVNCIEALVNLCDAQPDHVDDNGCSALHYAATLGHADATALLLKLGADPNRQDRKGRTPALCAAAKGQLETLKILAQHGGSLHARTVRGTGVAHEAVSSGRLELIKWIARRRPSLLDVATQDGKTPLHVAALHGQLDACKLLLDNGARINALLRTSKGALMTALDAALYRGHRDCAKLIQLHGGTTSQHLKSNKTGPAKVFFTKLRLQHTESSSDSELNNLSPRRRHHKHHKHHKDYKDHQDPDMYYEERWIERRTRRRANRRRLSREDSRSFSEEELRHSKSSSRAADKQRRALSENARYVNGQQVDDAREQQEEEEEEEEEEEDEEEDGEALQRRGSTRRRKRSEKVQPKRRSKLEEPSSKSESSELTKTEEDSQTVSDDSLEVVVVKRSLEKTSEKIVSGKKSKTSRDASKDSVKADAKKTTKKAQDAAKDDQSTKKLLKKKSSSQEQKSFDKDGDSTSQDTVMEQVTVTADVHKNGPYDVSKEKEKAEEVMDGEEVEKDQMRNKMDDILEKADELQNQLMTKAADLRKDMEDIRQQMTQKSEEKVELQEEEEQPQEQQRQSERTDEMTEKPEVEAKSEESSKESAETTSHEYPTSKEVSPKEEAARVEQRQKSIDPQISVQVPKADEKEEECPKEAQETSAKPEEVQCKADVDAKQSAEQDVQSIADADAKENAGQEVQSKADVYVQESAGQEVKHVTIDPDVPESKRGSIDKDDEPPDVKPTETKEDATSSARKGSKETVETQQEQPQPPVQIPGSESFRYADESSSSSPKASKPSRRRPSTGKRRGKAKNGLFESSEEHSPDHSAIVAVIESPEWDDEDEEELDKEIRQVVGDIEEHEDEEDEDEDGSDGLGGASDEVGIVRVLPSTSEDDVIVKRASAVGMLPQLQTKGRGKMSLRQDAARLRQRRDSGGRDSGIEPSPRVSRIPRRTIRCCPNTERQQALHMDTITRDVQISLRRYHLERKIFFQLMELKRLQIRHGRANENVLVKRQVESFHKAGMSGPALGVARYDQPYTFRHFETFLYEQLRRLQRRPSTPDWCTEAKQCTQKTHRCHHATSAYTSVPIYTYLGGAGLERPSLLPKIEGRGKGQMTVEVTHGAEKQVIALPSEKLDRTKRYYVTFTVRGDTTDSDKPKTPCSSTTQRVTKSV